MSSQVLSMDYARDEQLADISPTKNNFHKFAKGGDRGKNEFSKGHQEESLGGANANEDWRQAKVPQRPVDQQKMVLNPKNV